MTDQTYSQRWAEIVRLAKLWHEVTAQQEADRRETLWAEHFKPYAKES